MRRAAELRFGPEYGIYRMVPGSGPNRFRAVPALVRYERPKRWAYAHGFLHGALCVLVAALIGAAIGRR